MARSSAIAAFSCGAEAEMLGSLMMLAKGSLVSSPSSSKVSETRLSSGRKSGKRARMRAAREMSRPSMPMPARCPYAWSTGSSE